MPYFFSGVCLPLLGSKWFYIFIYRLEEPPGELDSRTPATPTNWNQCFICQTVTDEPLKCPADSKRKNLGAGYVTFAQNVERFQDLNSLPVQFDIQGLDDGTGIADTLLSHRASWHDSCRTKFNSTQLKRAEKRKSACDDELAIDRAKKSTRKCTLVGCEAPDVCFFCDEHIPGETLHDASTFKLDARVRECALKLQDTTLLAKLSPGDLVAQSAKYHAKCLVGLYNAVRVLEMDSPKDSRTKMMHGIALADIVNYIEETKSESGTSCVFKMSDLARQYEERLQEYGLSNSSRIHSTKLKERILIHFPELEDFKEGRDVLLSFKQDVAPNIRIMHEQTYDKDALSLSMAAKIIRQEIFSQDTKFDGSFDTNCQEESVPQSLVTFVNSILYGPTLEFKHKSQISLTIAQLIKSNTRQRKGECQTQFRQGRRTETPLCVYLGLSVHAQTRKKHLVEMLFNLGISISYDRVLAISTQLANSVCIRFHEENVVCPTKLRDGLFTTSAIDNIDHNPSSRTAKASFHGTGISIFQHVTSENRGSARARSLLINENIPASKAVPTLPDFYTTIEQVALPKDATVPTINGGQVHEIRYITEALEDEHNWLDFVNETVGEDQFTDDMGDVSWAAYHAKKISGDVVQSDLSALLPLFSNEAKSVAMIHHAMNLIRNATLRVNPGQIPVIAVDQPLYAIAKQIQWGLPNSHGEDKFVIMLGGLHIEMAAFKLLGDLLEKSGWTSALVEANITTTGKADSFLKVSHLTRTRYAHQVTACSLYALLKKAFAEKATLNQGVLQFENWIRQASMQSPQFKFWYTVLNLQLLVFIFIKAIRLGRFQLYVDAIASIVPWFFALDHVNYARWLSVHLRDMSNLWSLHPITAREFDIGHFVIHKTKRVFSGIALDQAHEQNNASVKGDGGAVGLTENPSALRRWMVAGPEVSRLVEEFESCLHMAQSDEGIEGVQHHDVSQSIQGTFVHDISSLTQVICEMGNPFLEETQDLFSLDTKEFANPGMIRVVQEMETIGKKQAEVFYTERLIQNKKPISDKITKNKFQLFGAKGKKTTSTRSGKIDSLKSDCSLFSRLYIACQTRNKNLDGFFMHENQPSPPSLSLNGNLRIGSKSELLSKCLEPLSHSVFDEQCEVVILDGAAVVNFLKPNDANTFQDYATSVFLPYVKRQLKDAVRVDIIWDCYVDDSLKATVREKRGIGIRKRVSANTKMPQNWNGFLKVDENKKELFHFLATFVQDIEDGGNAITTYGSSVITNNKDIDCSSLQPCTHEEADTRIMVHLAHASRNGHKRIVIRTVDTDVVVLALSLFPSLTIDKLWISFGTGKNFRYIAIHDIRQHLGPDKCVALPFFHAFTGCDTVSSFLGKGKKTAWDAWMDDDDVTSFIKKLTCSPESVNEGNIHVLERLVIRMYDKTCRFLRVDACRKYLFSSKGKTMDSIPPTYAALVQHTKRAVFQGIHVWGQTLSQEPLLPSPQEYGWQRGSNGKWIPLWTTLPAAEASCQELLRCGCKKGCKRRCKCKRNNLPCTTLCACGGGLC